MIICSLHKDEDVAIISPAYPVSWSEPRSKGLLQRTHYFTRKWDTMVTFLGLPPGVPRTYPMTVVIGNESSLDTGSAFEIRHHFTRKIGYSRDIIGASSWLFLDLLYKDVSEVMKFVWLLGILYTDQKQKKCVMQTYSVDGVTDRNSG